MEKIGQVILDDTCLLYTSTSNEALKGPLGRKALTPLRGSKNFDPTDPACK